MMDPDAFEAELAQMREARARRAARFAEMDAAFQAELARLAQVRAERGSLSDQIAAMIQTLDEIKRLLKERHE